MALEDKEMDELKEIIVGSLKESGLADAAQTINTPPRITKDEIMAVRNTRERQKLISENMDLFK